MVTYAPSIYSVNDKHRLSCCILAYDVSHVLYRLASQRELTLIKTVGVSVSGWRTIVSSPINLALAIRYRSGMGGSLHLRFINIYPHSAQNRKSETQAFDRPTRPANAGSSRRCTLLCVSIRIDCCFRLSLMYPYFCRCMVLANLSNVLTFYVRSSPTSTFYVLTAL